MKFYALVLLVVFLSVFELPSDAQNAESTTEAGKRGGKHKKDGGEGFPKDISIRKKWLNACGLKENDILKNTRICGNHFSETCFHIVNTLSKRISLIKGSVPSLLLLNKKSAKRKLQFSDGVTSLECYKIILEQEPCSPIIDVIAQESLSSELSPKQPIPKKQKRWRPAYLNQVDMTNGFATPRRARKHFEMAMCKINTLQKKSKMDIDEKPLKVFLNTCNVIEIFNISLVSNHCVSLDSLKRNLEICIPELYLKEFCIKWKDANGAEHELTCDEDFDDVFQRMNAFYVYTSYKTYEMKAQVEKPKKEEEKLEDSSLKHITYMKSNIMELFSDSSISEKLSNLLDEMSTIIESDEALGKIGKKTIDDMLANVLNKI
ncbi:hypothetical protein FQA39_LY18232 [Lamprigera yunnana]|nr:hypothetical protein FQA39_LY18232 [Lamprigera yunnana]